MAKPNRRWFELAVVALLLTTVLWVAARYYDRLVVDTQAAATRLQARNLNRTLEFVHTLWRSHNARPGWLDYGDQALLINPAGWPVDARLPGSPAAVLDTDETPAALACERVLRALINVPYSDTVKPKWPQWQVSAPESGQCRYWLGAVPEPRFYLDYQSGSGQVTPSAAANRR